MIRKAGTRFFAASAVRQARNAASILPTLGEAAPALFVDLVFDLAGAFDLVLVFDLVRGCAAERERRPFF